MFALEVTINDEPHVIAGMPNLGRVGADLYCVSSNEGNVSETVTDENTPSISFGVFGGVGDGSGGTLSLKWDKVELAVGDEIRLRIVETDRADEPTIRRVITADDNEQKSREIYERLRKKFGDGG